MRHEVREPSDVDALADNWEISKSPTAESSQRIRSIDEIPPINECGGHEIRYLVDDVLPEGAVIGLTGDSGSGKSTLACAWAAKLESSSVAALVLDRENPISVVRDRLQRLAIKDGKMLRYWGGWLPEEAPQPASPIVLSWVIACTPRPLIIVDSLSAFHGGDQNDAGEMRTFMNQCRKLADLGATVAVLHHDGKADSAKDYRGSSDFKAAIDAGFHVTNFGENGRLDKLVLRCFKSRFGFAGELVYRYASGRFSRDESPEASIRTLTEQLAELLRSNAGIKAGEFEALAGERGLGRYRARVFLNNGVQSGSIRCEPGSRKNIKHYFWEEACASAE